MVGIGMLLQVLYCFFDRINPSILTPHRRHFQTKSITKSGSLTDNALNASVPCSAVETLLNQPNCGQSLEIGSGKNLSKTKVQRIGSSVASM